MAKDLPQIFGSCTLRRRADRIDWTRRSPVSSPTTFMYKLPERRRSSHPSKFPHLTLHVGTKRSAILIILVIESEIFCYPRESQTPILGTFAQTFARRYIRLLRASGKACPCNQQPAVSPTSRTGANSTRWLVLTYYCLLGIAQNVG